MAAPDFWADREGSDRVAATHRDLQSRLPALYEELARADAALAGAGAGASPAAGLDPTPDPPAAEGSSSPPGPMADRFPKP